jgi:hypothetical protein
VPLPTLVFTAFGIGLSAALLGAAELRISPRHALFSSAFRAFALFLVLLILPVSVYFYVFHGDWFLLYSVDVRRVPSALALLGFVAEAGIGVIGFMVGSAFARAQRMGVGYAIAAACVPLAVAVAFVWPERLRAVGTFAQYRGDFGLVPYGGPLMQAGIAMGCVLAVGASFLLVRIRAARRRA